MDQQVIPKAYNERARFWRERENLTVAEACERLGVKSPGYLCDIESGKENFGHKMYVRYNKQDPELFPMDQIGELAL